VNPLTNGVCKGLAAKARGNSDDAENANCQHRNNQGNFVFEILLHRPVSLVKKGEKQY
jgi:hypothetical protein